MPSSLLAQGYTPIGSAQDQNNLRRDHQFNLTLELNAFGKIEWLFTCPILQGPRKWQEQANILLIGDLVIVGDPEDFKEKGNWLYCQSFS